MTLDALPLVAVRWPSLVLTKGKPLSGTWSSFLESLKKPAPPFAGKDKHPGWSAVRCDPCQRKAAHVQSVSALVLDFDGGDPLDSVYAVWSAWAGLIATTKSHTPESPRCRAILPFTTPIDASAYARIWQWAEDRCRAAGLSPDKATKDPCRLWYLPGTLNGVPYEWRDLVGEVLDPAPILAQLDKQEKAKPAPSPRGGRALRLVSDPFREANSIPISDVASWLGIASGGEITCPGCGTVGSKRDTSVAFVGNGLKCSHNRCADKGVPGKPGFRTVLDLVVEVRRCTVAEALHLMAREFNFEIDEPPPPRELIPPRDDAPSIVECTEVEVAAALRSHSLASACRIIEGNACNVLDGKRLAFNEMGQAITLDGVDLTEEDVIAVRRRIEDRITVVGKHGHMPISLSRDDVRDALRLEATRHRYHPVRDYLLSRKWDGIERIDHVADEILHADDSPLTRTLIRRWFVSAAARPLQPGCKVDTVLVLYGKTGAFKSTFFRTLTQPWFSDSPIDIHSKDAFLTLSRLWVQEWAELESLFRARDADAVKSFLSSAEDLFRPPYDKCPIKIRRTSVIVGTTNRDEFLRDDTGNRRWWPITVGHTDCDLAEKWRDQLWAEAVDALQREKWWLTPEEDEQLADRNLNHLQSDAWREVVLDWVRTASETTTAECLKRAIGLDTEKWGKAEEMRVSSILRAAGYVKERRRNLPPLWVKP